MTVSPWTRIGAFLAALAVAAGAFGAHSLERKLDTRHLDNFKTAAQYQMYHALALVAVGLLASGKIRRGLATSVAGWAFLLGTLLFSGSLYALALGAPKQAGMITPIGGVAFLVGWGVLAACPSSGRTDDA